MIAVRMFVAFGLCILCAGCESRPPLTVIDNSLYVKELEQANASMNKEIATLCDRLAKCRVEQAVLTAHASEPAADKPTTPTVEQGAAVDNEDNPTIASLTSQSVFVLTESPAEDSDSDPAESTQPKWVARSGGNPHNSEWGESGGNSYIVCWSEGNYPIFSYHLGDKEAAERQAAKMNELGLGKHWRSSVSVEEGNRIHAILTGPGMTSLNYMD